jgi:hypothetical protein
MSYFEYLIDMHILIEIFPNTAVTTFYTHASHP